MDSIEQKVLTFTGKKRSVSYPNSTITDIVPAMELHNVFILPYEYKQWDADAREYRVYSYPLWGNKCLIDLDSVVYMTSENSDISCWDSKWAGRQMSAYMRVATEMAFISSGSELTGLK